MRGKFFDYVIGNPPYQEDKLGDNDGFAPPVYDKFMTAAYSIADKIELIHPARFLFDAGSTPKAQVFTPVWLCNRMNNFLDEDRFGRTG